MVKLRNSFNRLKPCRILVAGDLMLDTYTIGKARRISPEAPVPVVQVLREENRAGGAGNVALNLRSLGAEVVIFGRIGDDSTGEILKKELQLERVDLSGLFVEKGYSTPLKNRVISDNQQVVRVDYEQYSLISEQLEEEIVRSLPRLLKNIAAVAISDYGKGFLSKTMLKELIRCASAMHIPVITDPKGIDFSKYKGTTIIKPNLSEAYAAAGLEPGSCLQRTAQKLIETTHAETVIITRSEAGISLFNKQNERADFPVRIHEIKDVTGAGDTVLAMFAYAVGNNLELHTAAELSNIAAGMAIERVGCAQITLAELARRLLDEDAANKVFRAADFFVLGESLKGKEETILLGISGMQGMTSSIFSAIHQLARRPEADLVIFLQDHSPDQDFLDLLASMRDVKFIVVQSEELNGNHEVVHQVVRPKEVYTILDNKLCKV